MKINKTVKIILAVLAALIIIAIAVVAFLVHIGDPNRMLKNYATEVTEGEEYPGKFKNVLKMDRVVICMTSFKFTPEESAEYTFAANGEAISNSVGMDMFVMDEDLSELFEAANYGDEIGRAHV